METVNYWAVFAAAVSNMIIGFLWYGPVFGKPWKKIMGFTDEVMKAMKMTPLRAVALGFIATLIMACVFAHMLIYIGAYLEMSGIMLGLKGAFYLWLGFAAPITAGVVLWEGKPWKLWILNGGYYLVALSVMGVILTSFV